MSDGELKALAGPQVDPTPIFEQFRGSYGSELLTAAVAHFGVFRLLDDEPRSIADLQTALGLASRPMTVLVTALRAMGLLQLDSERHLDLTNLAREHLIAGGEFFVGDYVGLAASSPGVMTMVEHLRSDQPADIGGAGAAFIYREGIQSAMEQEDLARHFTLALAGRAKNVAPVLAERIPVSPEAHLVDVGGGTGICSIAFLRRNPKMSATVVDLPHVLTLAREFADEYGVSDRMSFVESDMFTYRIERPSSLILLSNVLHDWGEGSCQRLVTRYAEQLNQQGSLVIHDVFLNDEMDGPLPIALYSAALFTLTEGRAYSAGEYRKWLESAGLEVKGPIPTLIHCGALMGIKGA